VDAVDIRIIRTMGLQPYGRAPRPAAGLKASSIARALKMSPEAVRDRVDRMRAEGVIEGFEVFPNCRHLGLEATCYYLRLKDHVRAQEVARRLRAVEGLEGIYTFTEPELCINLLYRSPSDLERRLNLLLALAGEGTIEKFYDLDAPQVERPLSALDWRIIQELRGDALRPLADVARALRVSGKTVKRRFERMGREGAFFIIPVVDPAKVPGLILFELIVWLDAEAPADTYQAIARALDPFMVCVDYPSNPASGNFGFGLYATKLGDIEECRKRALAVRGVSRVRPLVLQGSEERFEWIDEAIAEKVRALAPAKVSAGSR